MLFPTIRYSSFFGALTVPGDCCEFPSGLKLIVKSIISAYRLLMKVVNSSVGKYDTGRV